VADLPYLVELWFDPDMNRREETIATAGHVKVARAAYKETMKLYPARLVTLSNRGMILARSDRPEPEGGYWPDRPVPRAARARW
jgi:hypothetical protein